MHILKETDLIKLFSEQQIQEAIIKLGEKLNADYENEEVYLICVLKGSVMFMTDLAKRLNMPVKMEFIRLSSYGSGFTSTGRVSVVDIALPDLNEKNVLIIEDIIDTGHTARFLMDFINHNFKPKALKFCSLLDKKCKREVDIDPDYHCLDVDDKFLVGYGLDYDGYFRNIPYIGYVEM